MTIPFVSHLLKDFSGKHRTVTVWKGQSCGLTEIYFDNLIKGENMDSTELKFIQLYADIESKQQSDARDHALLVLKTSFKILYGYELQTDPDPS